MINKTQPNAFHPRVSGALQAILILMVVSVGINYIDRTSLSTVALLLEREVDLAITLAKMGLLLSAFFWTYALLQIASGWLVDRYGVWWVMATKVGHWGRARRKKRVIGFGGEKSI